MKKRERLLAEIAETLALYQLAEQQSKGIISETTRRIRKTRLKKYSFLWYPKKQGIPTAIPPPPHAINN